MDPEQIARALMEKDPSMSPDLARRIAQNLVSPGAGPALEQYNQLYPGLTPPPPPPAPSYGMGDAAADFAASAPAQPTQHPTLPDDQIEQWVQYKQNEYREWGATPEQLAKWADFDRARYQRFMNQPNQRAQFSDSPPVVKRDEPISYRRQPVMNPEAQARLERMNGGRKPPVRPDAISGADPRTVRDPLVQAKIRRVARYQDIRARLEAGGVITESEQRWLDAVHASRKGQ